MNCNTQPYKIDLFTYKPSKPKSGMAIRDQQKYFVSIVQKWVNKNPKKYPGWFLNEFVSIDPEKRGYWNTVPDGGNKTEFFLLPKKQRDKWSTGGRLAYCKRTFYRKDPRWNDVIKAYTAPKKSNIDHGLFDYEKAKRNNQDKPINELMGLGERMKKKIGGS